MHFSVTSALCLTLGVVSAIPRQHQVVRACYEDNPLRALEHLSSQASTFCPQYLASAGVAVPSPLTQWQGARLSSACSCFDKTAVPAKPTTTTTKTSTTTTTPTTTPTKTTSTSKTSSSTTTTSPTTTKTSTSSTSSTTSTKPASTSIAPVKDNTAASAKRGIVYDYSSQNSYFNFFTGSPYVSFGSNWYDTRATGNGITLPSSFTFVPTLRVDSSLTNNNWNNNVNNAIKAGTKWLFASNEPDNAGQANLSPSDTAKVYLKYMQQFKGQALLATPAVTNGGGQTGLNFLGQFLGNCTSCHFDMINIHYYVPRSQLTVDQAVQALKTYIEQNVPALQAQHTNIQNIPIMVGEFWLTGASLAEGGTFLQEIMPYLDCKSNIIGYQAFGGLWPGNFITSDGTGLTPAGTAYKSYSKAC